MDCLVLDGKILILESDNFFCLYFCEFLTFSFIQVICQYKKDVSSPEYSGHF